MKLKSQLDSTYKLFQDSTKIYSHLIGKNYPLQLIQHETRYFWYTMNAKRIEYYKQNYSTKKNDVFVMGYPKSGNHWLKKIVVEILGNSDKNSNDYTFYKDGDIGFNTAPQFEMYISQVDDDTFNQRVEDTSYLSNRLWFSHNDIRDFPIHDFNGKIIMICRNPKDVIVSGYHFFNDFGHDEYAENITEYDINDYLTYFYRGMLLFGDYFEWNELWWLYYKNNQNRNNMLWIYYEDMIVNPMKYIKIISSFLNDNKHETMTENEYEIVLDKSGIISMKNELKTNPQSLPIEMYTIVRNGINNDWENILSEKDSFLIDEMMFFKWSQNANDIKYYQELMQNEYFKNAQIKV